MGPFLHWLILFLFWLTLSGVFDAEHVGIGVLVTLGIALRARPMQQVDLDQPSGRSVHLARVPWGRVFAYSIWLLREIARSNVQVARIVLDPKLPIDPALVRVRTRVTSDTGITLLANSITATPGTITVRGADEENREFVIHALTNPEQTAPAVADMEERIIAALGSLESTP